MDRTLTLPPAALALPVSENSQVGEARRQIVRLAADGGLSAGDCARVGLIVTELGTNLVKHARNGELLARTLAGEGGVGVVIHSIDRGPGMRSVEECQRDGFSTAGSAGIGLGTVRRQADTLHIYSLERVGTVIAAGIAASPPPPNGLESGLIIAPAPSETACGDACAIAPQAGHTTLLMVDGLGHGPFAADAADEAVRVMRAQAGRTPAELILSIHDALKKTRGAAVAVARIATAARELSFCSVGNITASLVRYGHSKTLPTGNGIVGHILPRPETVTLPWTGRDLLVMHSDGLHAQPRVYDQPGLLVRPPSLIAGMLYGQQKRGRDDASVLVVRTLEP